MVFSPTILKSDGVSALTALVDTLAGGTPIASITLSISNQWTTSRDSLFAKKILNFIKELSEIDGVLLSQTLENLRLEYGEDIFNETLFSVIEKANSTEQSILYARLLKFICREQMTPDNFFELQNCIEKLTISDLRKLPQVIEADEKLVSSTTADRLEDYKQVAGISRLLRYQSVGLAMVPSAYGRGGPPRIEIELAKRLCRAISSK